MSYPFVPRFVYGVGGDVTDWTATLPLRAWNRRTATVGGSRTSAGGVPASYIVRRDHILSLEVRIYEYEWPDLAAVIEWGQFAESFTFYIDANGEVYPAARSVWLEAPQGGVDIRPDRLGEFPRVLIVPIELRSVDFGPWLEEYFAEPIT